VPSDCAGAQKSATSVHRVDFRGAHMRRGRTRNAAFALVMALAMLAARIISVL